MDALDLRIVQALGVHPFVGGPRRLDALKPAQVAKTVGVTLDTAKARIQRMEAAGIIRGYEIHPNPAHLGLRNAVFHFRIRGPDKPKALERIVALDGVSDLMDFVGDGVDVGMLYRSESDLARRVGLVEEVADAEQVERYAVPPAIPVERDLSALDWRIIGALRGRAKRDPSEVAEEISVSRRTVTRRLDAMADERSIDVYALVDPGPVPGVIPVCLICRFEDGHPRAEVRAVTRLVEDRILFGWEPAEDEPGFFRLACVAASLADAEALRRRALEGGSVVSAWTQFPSGRAWRTPWVEEAIQERVLAHA